MVCTLLKKISTYALMLVKFIEQINFKELKLLNISNLKVKFISINNQIYIRLICAKISRPHIYIFNIMLDQTYSSSFEVEQIVDEKIIDGQTHFLVKWVGYGHEENTWQPQRHMVNSEDKIRDWENYKIRQLRLASSKNTLENLDLGSSQNKNLKRGQQIFKESRKNVSNPYRKVLPNSNYRYLDQLQVAREKKSQIQTIFDQPQMKRFIKNKKSERKKKELQLFEKRLKSRPKVWQQYLQNEEEVIRKANQKIKQVIDKAYGYQKEMPLDNQNGLISNKIQIKKNIASSSSYNLQYNHIIRLQESRMKADLKNFSQQKEKDAIQDEKTNEISIPYKKIQQHQIYQREQLLKSTKVQQKNDFQLQKPVVSKKKNIFSSSEEDKQIDQHLIIRHKVKFISKDNLLLQKQPQIFKSSQQKFNKNDPSLQQSTNFILQKQIKTSLKNQQKNIQSKNGHQKNQKINIGYLKEDENVFENRNICSLARKNAAMKLIKQMVSQNAKKSIQRDIRTIRDLKQKIAILPETIRLTGDMITNLKRNKVESQKYNQHPQIKIFIQKNQNRSIASSNSQISSFSDNADQNQQNNSQIKSRDSHELQKIIQKTSDVKIGCQKAQKCGPISHLLFSEKTNPEQIIENACFCPQRSIRMIDTKKLQMKIKQDINYQHEYSISVSKNGARLKQNISQILSEKQNSSKCQAFQKNNQQTLNEIKLEVINSFVKPQSQCDVQRKIQEQIMSSNQLNQNQIKMNNFPFVQIEQIKSEKSLTETKRNLSQNKIVSHRCSPRISKSQQLEGKAQKLQFPFECSISTIAEISIKSIDVQQSQGNNIQIELQLQEKNIHPLINLSPNAQQIVSKLQSEKISSKAGDQQSEDSVISVHRQLSNPERVINYSSLTNHMSTALPESSIHSNFNLVNIHLIPDNLIRHQSSSTRASWHTLRTANNEEVDSSPTQYYIPSQEVYQFEQEKYIVQEVSQNSEEQQDKCYQSVEGKKIPLKKSSNHSQKICKQPIRKCKIDPNLEVANNSLSLQELLDKINNSSIQCSNPQPKDVGHSLASYNSVNTFPKPKIKNNKRDRQTKKLIFQKPVAVDLVNVQQSYKFKLHEKSQEDCLQNVSPQMNFKIPWPKRMHNSIAKEEIKTPMYQVSSNFANIKKNEENSEQQKQNNSESYDQVRLDKVIDYQEFILYNDITQVNEMSK